MRQKLVLERISPNKILKKLEEQARGFGLDQCAWAAKVPGLTRARLSLAINGKANLSEAQLKGLVDALKLTMDERNRTFHKFLSIDLPQAVADARAEAAKAGGQ